MHRNKNARSFNRVTTMKNAILSLRTFRLAMVALLAPLTIGAQTQLAANNSANRPAPIPLDQLGAVAGKQYQGDGLSVTATAEGAFKSRLGSHLYILQLTAGSD